MKGRCAYSLIAAIGLLSLGISIYLGFRTTELYYLHFFPNGRLPMWLIRIREHVADTSLPGWIRYNLPDGLWLFSYMIFIDLIWGESMRHGKILFLMLLPLGAMVAETLQIFRVIPGTGDWLDFVFYLLSIFIFIIIKTRPKIR